MSDYGISGRVAAVAGASSGLGLGVARALRLAGVEVAISARGESRLRAAAQAIGATPIAQDVSTPEGAAEFVARATAELGPLDIVVANAGGPGLMGVQEATIEDFQRALAANLLSVVAMCSSALPHMTKQGWGRLIAITSISARQPLPMLVLSNTARAGVTGYLKSLSVEVASRGVTVNSLQPGYHRTPRIADAASSHEALLTEVPAGRLGDPDDFGEVAAFLCSEQANFITGVALPIDGGQSRGLM